MRTPSRVATGLLAVALAAASVSGFSDRSQRLDSTVARWISSDLADRHPTVEPSIRRERDPIRADLLVARAALSDSVDMRYLTEADSTAREGLAARADRRLDEIQTAAQTVLQARPTDWEAAMVLGGSRFLADWRRGRDDLYRRPEGWRAPLDRSRALAPGSEEPIRLRVMGDLTIWHTLSDRERGSTRGHLSSVFADPTSLRRLFPVWSVVATDWDDLTEPLPDSPVAWTLVRDLAQRQGAWDRVCDAETARARASSERARALLDEAADRRSGGDLRGARSLILSILAELPPSTDHVELVSRAVAMYPRGPIAERVWPRLTAWLEWSLDLKLLGQPGLPYQTEQRIVGMVGDLAPPLAATSAMLAGDRVRAEQIAAREPDRRWSAAWAPFVIASALQHRAEGDDDEADRALENVHRSWRDRLPYLAATRVSAESITSHVRYWRRNGREMVEISVPDDTSGIEIAVLEASASGAAIEVLVDGGPAGCHVVRPEETLRVPASKGSHLVEVRSVGRTSVLTKARPVPVDATELAPS